MRIRSTLALLALFLVSTSTYADEKADTGRLTIDRIYEAPEFGGEHFSGRWVEGFDGYLTWEPSSDPVGGNDLVRNDPATGAKEVIVSAARLVPEGGSGPLNVENYAFSQDRSKLLIFTNSKRVWRQNTRGDYWVLDRGSRELRKLGGSAPESSLMFAKLSPDGLRAAYVRDNAIFVEDLRDHGIIEVSSPTSEPGVIQGTFDWVYEEELNLRDGFRWSPDSKMIAYWRLETKEEPDFPLVNNTAGLYPNIKTFKYPKVGERNAAAYVGVVFAAGGGTRWLDVPGDPRENYLAYLEWHKPSGGLVVQQLNRLQQIERVFFATGDTLKEGAGDPPVLANDEPAAMRYVLTEHDDAWVDHQEKIHWIDKGQAFLWLSERDGWRHVYRAPLDGKAETLITPGDYDVIKIEAVDHNEGLLYFQAAPDEPTRRSLFRVKLDGTGLERVTPQNQPGTHEYDISPDAKWAIHHFSAADTPPTVDLVRLPSHERVRPLIENADLKAKFEALQKRPTEFFRVDIGDGVALDAWCVLPPDLDPSKKYPLLVYVYGEPAGSTVEDAWDGGNQLWHRMLAQEGYVVMSFDNRGTNVPRGRAWRKSIYRKIGILAPEDQAKAVRKVLSQRPYLDPKHVGVWGWSGGGSMSLNAIFKYPDLYSTAIAIAPVANQRYYDTIYQERYMGLPGDNAEGYTQGSPITHAKGLKGNLLLIHGTGDDNCHYQTTETLINELIRLDKPFSMMAYPGRSHSIHEGPNTTRHLRSLMTSYLRRNLPSR